MTVWFTVLFVVLPFGVRSPHATGEIAAGSVPGAPVAPRMAWRQGYMDSVKLGGHFATLTAIADYVG